jgi:hypothetical protein
VIDCLIDSANYILTTYSWICNEVYRLATNRANKCNLQLTISWKYGHSESIWKCLLFRQITSFKIARIIIGQFRRYRDSLRAGRSRARIPVGARYSATSRPALEPTKPPVQWLRYLFAGNRAADTWCWQPTLSNAEVKERIESSLFPISGTSRSAVGRTSFLPFSSVTVQHSNIQWL